MSNDKMREEFEAAYMKDVSERFRGAEVGDDEWVARGSNGEYRSFRAAGAWWAWQASRESLVIELPQRWSVDGFESGWIADPDGANLDYAETVKAIEACGLKVKL